MDSSSPPGRLTPLQFDVLRAFLARRPSFFLTGGAVLAGWTLRHRETHDVDLFTTARGEYATAPGALADVTQELGGSLEGLTLTTDFRRYLVRRGSESVIVDLVFDRAPQIRDEKPVVDGIPMDGPDEILANKICALIGRAELRDLVDLLFLERAGWRVEDHMAGAARKDAGVSPAVLAWVLSELRIGDDARLPADVTIGELRAFVDGLQQRLRRMALPAPA